MSGRLVKKFLKEQEEAQQQLKSSTQHLNSSDDELDSPPHSFKNPFDLLNQQDQGNESESADESPIENTKDKEPSPVKETINTVSVSSSNKKSKKKKKKKEKSKEDSFSSTKNIGNISLDDKLENLSFGVDTSSQPGPSKVKPANGKVNDSRMKQSTSSILQVDPKFLSAENELRRIFGSKVVNSFEKSNQTGSSRQVRGGRRGTNNHRKTILVSSSDHWPRWDGSLSMEFLETKDGYHYFRYVHSSSYSQAQRAFEAAKAIYDLNGIASILQYHPYHIDSLITIAEYYKFSGEQQMSAEATAKCLFALECAWHPMFTPLQGNCQLKHTHETNKSLFSTLFAHMKNMDRRGCHRSALEICKLLLSIDSDDPLGAMFCIDYFSLRAQEYAWLERFSEEYKSDNSLYLYPNFSFSLSICRFYLEREDKSETESGKATSADLMKQALMLHPSVVKKLVEKVPLKDQAWTNILKNSFFGGQTGTPSSDHLINIYVERCYIIWRLPDLQKLLRDSALGVIQKLEQSPSVARDWACVRKEAFPSEKNEYSHLMVFDFSDSVPTMPPEMLQNFMVEPRMMVDMENREHAMNPPAGTHAPVDVANRNALAVLFESMLPWNYYGTRADEDDQHQHENED